MRRQQFTACDLSCHGASSVDSIIDYIEFYSIFYSEFYSISLTFSVDMVLR